MEHPISQDRRLAGVGGIAFSVGLGLGFSPFGPRGGHYAASALSSFVGQSSTSVIVSIYLFAVSTIGLIVLMAYLSETCFGRGRYRRLAWGTSLLAASSLLTGWSLYFAPYTSVLSGGPGVDPAVVYTFVNAGLIVLFGVGGILVGIPLVLLALRGQKAPMWVRACSGLTGLSAFVSWAFLLAWRWSANEWLPLTYYPVVLWGLAIGIWLLVSSPRPDEPPPVSEG